MRTCVRFGVHLMRDILNTYQSLKVSNKTVAKNKVFIDSYTHFL